MATPGQEEQPTPFKEDIAEAKRRIIEAPENIDPKEATQLAATLLSLMLDAASLHNPFADLKIKGEDFITEVRRDILTSRTIALQNAMTGDYIGLKREIEIEGKGFATSGEFDSKPDNLRLGNTLKKWSTIIPNQGDPIIIKPHPPK